MTTDEKLKHFLDTCMEDARIRSSRMLDEYTSALEKDFKEHQQKAQHRTGLWVRQETDKIEKDINKKLSEKQLDLKRFVGRKQEELKEKLFARLEEKLKAYQKTPEYEGFLERQVENALEFAKGEKLCIYLDPLDGDKQERFGNKYPGAEFHISSYSFLGGIRGVVSSGNILIDDSFQARMKELREKFHFDFTLEKQRDMKKGGSADAGEDRNHL